MKYDVYIKDEGYADVKFISLKAKEWAHKNKVPNSLESFGKEFCGRSVWYPGMKEGLYTVGIKLGKLGSFIKNMKKAGLKIESEICDANL